MTITNAIRETNCCSANRLHHRQTARATLIVWLLDDTSILLLIRYERLVSKALVRRRGLYASLATQFFGWIHLYQTGRYLWSLLLITYQWSMKREGGYSNWTILADNSLIESLIESLYSIELYYGLAGCIGIDPVEICWTVLRQWVTQHLGWWSECKSYLRSIK